MQRVGKGWALQLEGMEECCKPPFGAGEKPQKLCKFHIIKLQKDKEFHLFFVYFLCRIQSKQPQNASRPYCACACALLLIFNTRLIIIQSDRVSKCERCNVTNFDFIPVG